MSRKIIGVTVGTTVNPKKIGGATSYEVLETNNKTLVGAINELNSALDGKVSVFNISTEPTMTMLDVITAIQDAGGNITSWNIINFSGYQSATIGVQMAHYGGNVYNICGIDLSRMTVVSNADDYSTMGLYEFMNKFAAFQNQSDESLETTDKTIVGAINEINAKIADLPTEFTPAEHTHNVEDITDFQDVIDNLNISDSVYVGSEEPDGNYDIWIDPNGDKTDIVVPTVSVEKIDGGHRVSIADAYDVDTFDVMDGKDGKTPYIQDSYWYINGASTGVKAQGNDGYTPVKGTDYWTPTDKSSIIEETKSEVLNSLNYDVFGTVDENNNIVVNTALPDGTYTFGYEKTDGTLIEIGTITIGGSVAINIVWNQGYKCGYNTGNTDALTEGSNYYTSDKIEVVSGSNYIVSIGTHSQDSSHFNARAVYYNSSNTVISAESIDITSGGSHTLSIPSNCVSFRIRSYYDYGGYDLFEPLISMICEGN